MDVRLAVSGSHTDGSVLQGSTESTHRVSFEVRQVDHKIVIGDVRADYVVLDPFVILHRNLNLAFRIHNVHRSDLVIASFSDRLEVILCVAAVSAIGRVALNYGSVDFMHERCDKLWPQMIGLLGLSCGDLYGDFPLRLNTQRLVQFHKSLWRDVLRKIHDRGFLLTLVVPVAST